MKSLKITNIHREPWEPQGIIEFSSCPKAGSVLLLLALTDIGLTHS